MLFRSLPESFDAATRAFIERHLGVGTDAFAYLALPPGEGPGELAPLGRERSIAAFVLPERTEEIAVDDVALVPATRSDTMFRLIDQHIGTRPPAEAMVVRLAQLIERVPCWKVRYQRADLAARYLVNHPFA